VTALITTENVLTTPIQRGDAGIVLKPDGTFQVFSTGEIDPETLTDAQIDQGRKILALAYALKNPAILDQLYMASETMTAMEVTLN